MTECSEMPVTSYPVYTYPSPPPTVTYRRKDFQLVLQKQIIQKQLDSLEGRGMKAVWKSSYQTGQNNLSQHFKRQSVFDKGVTVFVFVQNNSVSNLDLLGSCLQITLSIAYWTKAQTAMHS